MSDALEQGRLAFSQWLAGFIRGVWYLPYPTLALQHDYVACIDSKIQVRKDVLVFVLGTCKVADSQ